MRLNKTTLCEIERGVFIPKAETLSKIGHGLGIDGRLLCVFFFKPDTVAMIKLQKMAMEEIEEDLKQPFLVLQAAMQ